MEEYQPQTREDMQDAIKGIFGPMFEAMLQGEMDPRLGYGNNERGEKNTTNRRNGYSHKSVNTAYGKMDVSVPRGREGSFEPKAISDHGGLWYCSGSLYLKSFGAKWKKR